MWQPVSGTRELGLELGNTKLLHRTPFSRFRPRRDFLRDQRALVGGKENLPYGLDIWHARKKVLNVEWSDDGDIVSDLVSSRRVGARAPAGRRRAHMPRGTKT